MAKGTFVWHELMTTDIALPSRSTARLEDPGVGGARCELLDVCVGEVPIAGMLARPPELAEAGVPPHWLYKAPSVEHPLGGMSNSAKAMGFPPSWLYYIHVGDLEAAIERVKSHGGELVNGPMEVPGGDRIAHCRDPQGAMFALHTSAT